MQHLTIRQRQARLANFFDKALHKMHALLHQRPRCILAQLVVEVSQQLRCLNQRHPALSSTASPDRHGPCTAHACPGQSAHTLGTHLLSMLLKLKNVLAMRNHALRRLWHGRAKQDPPHINGAVVIDFGQVLANEIRELARKLHTRRASACGDRSRSAAEDLGQPCQRTQGNRACQRRGRRMV